MKVSKSEHTENEFQATLSSTELDAIAASVPTALTDPDFAKLKSIDLFFNEHGGPTGVYRGNKKKADGKATPLPKEIVDAAVKVASVSVREFVSATLTLKLAAEREAAAETEAAEARAREAAQ